MLVLLAAPRAGPAAPTLAHYQAVAEKSVMPRALGNSLGVATLTTLLYVTLPMLRSILLIALLFRTLDALRAFDLMFVLTGGGPAGTTETLTVYAYRSLFQTLQLGFGAAIGVVIFALVMLVAWAYLRSMRTATA